MNFDRLDRSSVNKKKKKKKRESDKPKETDMQLFRRSTASLDHFFQRVTISIDSTPSDCV